MRRTVFALLAVSLVASCSSPDGEVTGSATSIVIGAGSEPENLNPVLGYAPDGAAKIFDGLVSRDASLALVPALAVRAADRVGGRPDVDGQAAQGHHVLRRHAGVRTRTSCSPTGPCWTRR